MTRSAVTLLGYLVTWSKMPDRSHVLPHGGDMREERIIEEWHHWRLTSRRPLLDEPNELATYAYDVYLRQWKQRLIIVSLHVRIVEEALRRMGIDYAPVTVEVARLVTEVTEQPHERFTLSRIFARIDGYGQTLRSMALYGDDIADSGLFRSILGQLLPYRVELRDVRTGNGLLSIASRGEISFLHRSDAAFAQVVDTLKHLRPYIAWGDDR